MERDKGSSPCSLAKSLSFVAHGNLLRSENDADWIYRILGIYVAGAPQSLAIFEVDRRDGTLCPSQTQDTVKDFR